MSRAGLKAMLLSMAAAMLLTVGAAAVRAQSSRPIANAPTGVSAANPVPAAPADDIEKKPIRRSSANAGTPTTNATSTVKPQTGLDYGRLMLAMGVVLGLILLLKFVGLRMFPASAQSKTSGVIRVLSRSAVAPKQQFLLVQVGGRLIVVADSHSRMTPLTEITDPAEVASIVGQISAESPASISSAFNNLFGKARQKFDTDVEELSKRPLKQESGNVLYDDSAGGARNEHEDDVGAPRDDSRAEPALDTATMELKDLGERVRALAGQIRGR